MGLVRLRGAAPLGGERLVGVVARARLVALDHGDPVPRPAERQGGRQAADPASDDHDPLAGPRTPVDHALPLATIRSLTSWQRSLPGL